MCLWNEPSKYLRDVVFQYQVKFLLSSSALSVSDTALDQHCQSQTPYQCQHAQEIFFWCWCHCRWARPTFPLENLHSDLCLLRASSKSSFENLFASSFRNCALNIGLSVYTGTPYCRAVSLSTTFRNVQTPREKPEVQLGVAWLLSSQPDVLMMEVPCGWAGVEWRAVGLGWIDRLLPPGSLLWSELQHAKPAQPETKPNKRSPSPCWLAVQLTVLWSLCAGSGVCWCYCGSGNEVSSLAEAAVSRFLRVHTMCQQKDGFTQVIAITAFLTGSRGRRKKNPFWMPNADSCCCSAAGCAGVSVSAWGRTLCSSKGVLLYSGWLCAHTSVLTWAEGGLCCGLPGAWRCLSTVAAALQVIGKWDL